MVGDGGMVRAYGTMCGPFQTERFRREKEGRIVEREKERRRRGNYFACAQLAWVVELEVVLNEDGRVLRFWG